MVSCLMLLWILITWYLKVGSWLVITFMFISWCEAHFFIKNARNNSFWEKPKLTHLPQTSPLISVLMYISQTTAFDIAKNRILRKYIKRKFYFTFSFFIMRFLYIMFDISKILLLCVGLILHMNSKEKFLRYLSVKYTSIYYKRERLLFMDNDWRVNPTPRVYILNQILMSKYPEYKSFKIASDLDDIALKLEKKNYNLDVDALVLKSQSSNKKHKVYKNLVNDSNFYGMMTDYRKAELNNFYNREIVVEKIFIKKESTILYVNKDEFHKANDYIFNENATPIAWWLLLTKHNESLLHKDIYNLKSDLYNTLIEKDYWNMLDDYTKYLIIKVLTQEWLDNPYFGLRRDYIDEE